MVTSSTIKAFAKRVKVRFAYIPGAINGSLLYKVNVSADPRFDSNLTLEFREENHGARSFRFEACQISCVTCRKIRDNSVVRVEGKGAFAGTSFQRHFVAEFVDQPKPAENDAVQSFVIANFFSQGGVVKVPQGSLIATGKF
ncbi:hypothetical protein SPSYN_02974 [Sporotomaculum syntrophicum]|uniref:Uncharacterized protein n=1 Tax=Sporotomaculum syntrophicum TaxID=182264 RepID=A0A9D3AXN3_9FIRM|nr:hypothetical protein [Sporotomaculum syntrophicum]KAF1083818.1 hypothetical protein SPSYN_02974 [Sporotomaculum syntrophicum]